MWAVRFARQRNNDAIRRSRAKEKVNMAAPILVMGHKNPDNDAICSAIAYAYLKNELAKRNGSEDVYKPVRLGPLPPETAWLIDEYGLEVPEAISHVHARVRDVMTPDPISVSCTEPLLTAGHILRRHNVRALVVVNDEGKFKGLITTRMIAERYIASTDAMEDNDNAPKGAAFAAAAADLITSLYEPVDKSTETDVLVFKQDDLLNEAVEDLMASSLREAVVLDDNGFCIGIVTRSNVTRHPQRRVVLVDHNETRQAANGIEEAQIVEVVDHHRIGDISTTAPIRFTNMPVGSTATIVAMEFRNQGIEIPRSIAAVLLSAILTDTVILKSPTATYLDKEQVTYLEQLLEVDHVQFGLDIFKCRGGEASMPVEKLVGADAKEFQLGDHVVYIAQRETVDLPAVMEREKEIRAYMKAQAEMHGYEFYLLMVTDIMAEGSQFLCEGNRRIVERAFNISCKNGSNWMPGILSRKKQVAARILGA